MDNDRLAGDPAGGGGSRDLRVELHRTGVSELRDQRYFLGRKNEPERIKIKRPSWETTRKLQLQYTANQAKSKQRKDVVRFIKYMESEDIDYGNHN